MIPWEPGPPYVFHSGLCAYLTAGGRCHQVRLSINFPVLGLRTMSIFHFICDQDCEYNLLSTVTGMWLTTATWDIVLWLLPFEALSNFCPRQSFIPGGLNIKITWELKSPTMPRGDSNSMGAVVSEVCTSRKLLGGFDELTYLRTTGLFILLMRHAFIKHLLHTLNCPCLFVAEPDPARVSAGVTAAGPGPSGRQVPDSYREAGPSQKEKIPSCPTLGQV